MRLVPFMIGHPIVHIAAGSSVNLSFVPPTDKLVRARSNWIAFVSPDGETGTLLLTSVRSGANVWGDPRESDRVGGAPFQLPLAIFHASADVSDPSTFAPMIFTRAVPMIVRVTNPSRVEHAFICTVRGVGAYSHEAR